MTKRRAIISYDKLTVDQKKQILKVYPDGYINHLTQIKTPNGEILDAFIWETDDVIYLVKIKHGAVKPKKNIGSEDNEDEDDEFEDELDKEEEISDLDIEDSMSESEEEEEDEYDKPDLEEDDNSDEES